MRRSVDEADIAMIVALLLVAMFIGCVILIVLDGRKYDIARREFMAACIEFHPENVCAEYDHYGRRDLGLRK